MHFDRLDDKPKPSSFVFISYRAVVRNIREIAWHRPPFCLSLTVWQWCLLFVCCQNVQSFFSLFFPFILEIDSVMAIGILWLCIGRAKRRDIKLSRRGSSVFTVVRNTAWCQRQLKPTLLPPSFPPTTVLRLYHSQQKLRIMRYSKASGRWS